MAESSLSALRSPYARSALHAGGRNGLAQAPVQRPPAMGPALSRPDEAPPPPPAPLRPQTSKGPNSNEAPVLLPLPMEAVHFGRLRLLPGAPVKAAAAAAAAAKAADPKAAVSGFTSVGLRLLVSPAIPSTSASARPVDNQFRLNIDFRHFTSILYCLAARTPTVVAMLTEYAAKRVRQALEDVGPRDGPQPWYDPDATEDHARRWLILRLRAPLPNASATALDLKRILASASDYLQRTLASKPGSVRSTEIHSKCISADEMRAILRQALGALALPPAKAVPATDHSHSTVQLAAHPDGHKVAKVVKSGSGEAGGRESGRKRRALMPAEFEALVEPKPHELETGPMLAIDAVDPEAELFVFPPGEKGAVSVRRSDLDTIAPTQFINDSLIDFFLLYTLKSFDEPLRRRIHIFSTFFYSSLTKKVPPTPKIQASIPAALKAAFPKTNDAKIFARHSNVQKWTKSFDLFEKDFVVIPINEDAHWYLAIVCFPGRVGPAPKNEGLKVEPKEEAKEEAMDTAEAAPAKPLVPYEDDDAPKEPPTAAASRSFDSAPTEVASSAQQPSTSGGGRSRATRWSSDKASDGVKEEPKEEGLREFREGRQPEGEPCILIFNSLLMDPPERPKRGPPELLREYLRVEWAKRKGPEGAPAFTSASIPGHYLLLPQQANFWDCGIFLLMYVEEFFRQPPLTFPPAPGSLRNWFAHDPTKKRHAIRQVINDIYLQTKERKESGASVKAEVKDEEKASKDK